jgi:hypothetical protein
VRACSLDESLPLHIGIDFNINPMSATVFQEHGAEIWQVGEIVIQTSNTHELCDEISLRYPQFEKTRITTYPDPAGAQRRTSAQGLTDIGILRKAGFNVVAMTSHPLVRDRVNIVNGKICSADGVRHLFVDPSCKESIKCYEQLCYKEGTGQPDKESGLDHIPDSAGYYIYGRFAYKPTQSAHVPHMHR